jgi:hypothetical protein
MMRILTNDEAEEAMTGFTTTEARTSEIKSREEQIVEDWKTNTAMAGLGGRLRGKKEV